MSLQTAGDIPLKISSENSGPNSERRITPSWTIEQLKGKLEPVTGIPPSAQKLTLNLGGRQPIPIESYDEASTQIGSFPLAAYAKLHMEQKYWSCVGRYGLNKLEACQLDKYFNGLWLNSVPVKITFESYEAAEESGFLYGWKEKKQSDQVEDTRPLGMRPNFNDVSKVAKVEISTEKYAQLPDTVLAWKQKSKLGRFDPSAPTAEDRAAQQEAKLQAYEDTITARGIEVGKRCRVGEDDARRGEVAYVGEVEKIPGGGKWIGVKLDEPVGKNDGSLDGHRYWGKDADGGGPGPKYGVFVRPERVEVGDWPVQDDLDDIEF